MKNAAFILLASLLFAACNNSERERQLKELSVKDSTLLQQTQQKDSTIMSYVHSLNDIQENLNAIKAKEHIISTNGEAGTKDLSGSIVSDIKSLDQLIVQNQRDMYALEKKLKATNKQDDELRKMITNLSKEINDKDVEIAELESRLSKANDSIRIVVSDFKDTMNVIDRQRMEITSMKNEMNSVYYAIGTYKELKKMGVIESEGGVVGIGSTATLKQDFNSSYFTSAMMPDLQTIPLYSKFVKIVTNHPNDSYKVVHNSKSSDSFVITNPATFWSEGKYLVIVVNQEAPKRTEVTSAN